MADGPGQAARSRNAATPPASRKPGSRGGARRRAREPRRPPGYVRPASLRGTPSRFPGEGPDPAPVRRPRRAPPSRGGDRGAVGEIRHPPVHRRSGRERPSVPVAQRLPRNRCGARSASSGRQRGGAANHAARSRRAAGQWPKRKDPRLPNAPLSPGTPPTGSRRRPKPRSSRAAREREAAARIRTGRRRTSRQRTGPLEQPPPFPIPDQHGRNATAQTLEQRIQGVRLVRETTLGHRPEVFELHVGTGKRGSARVGMARPGGCAGAHVSPMFVARAPRCRDRGPHGPKERMRAAEGAADTGACTLSKRLEGARPASASRLASAAGHW